MINKFFNWVFVSFFRTAGRFLFYFLLFLLLSFLIHSCEAKAATYPPYGWDKGTTSTFKSGNEGLPAWFGNTDDNYYSTYTVYNPYEAVNDIGAATSKYIIIDMCYNLPTSYFAFNSSDDSINESLIQYLETGPSNCYFSSVSTGTNYRIYLPISNWKVPSNGSDVYVATITIGAHWPSNVYHEGYIRNIVVTDEWTYESDKQVIEQNNKLNSINTAINSTNTKLDSVNSAINSTNDKLDKTNENLNKVDESINNMNDSITSTEGADLGALENSAGWLPAGPVDSILNLPLSLMNNLTTNLNKSCNPLVVPIPFVNKDLTIPCLNTIYESIEGLNVWITTISVIASGFILYSYFLKLYKWVEDTLMFNDSNGLSSWGGV